MPDSDVHRLQALAQQLTSASNAQDWQRLGQLDQLLSQWLMQRAGQPPATGALLQAWQLVARTHAQSHAACQQAMQQAGAQLRSLQHHNEAQQAYAWQEHLS